MKTAIVYYSLNGNTEYAANEISNILGADLIPIKPVKAYADKGFRKFLWGGKSVFMGETPELQPYEFSASDYDIVIIGTPVWASSFSPPIRTFVEENRAALQSKELAVFTCFSGGGAEKAIEKLRSFIDTDDFTAKLILVDPKTKPDTANAGKIKAFCSALSE